MDFVKHILPCFIIIFLHVFSTSQVVVDTTEYGLDYGDEDDLSYYDNAEDDLKGDDTGFLCSDKKYVVSSFLCDGLWDCDDGADEDPLVCEDFGVAPAVSTLPTPLTTSAPQPIDLDARGADRDHTSCEADEFVCMYNRDTCIPEESRCDGFMDCPDGEDEESCDISPTADSAENYFDEYDDANQDDYETAGSKPSAVDTNSFGTQEPPSSSGTNGFINRLVNRSRLQIVDSDWLDFRLTHRKSPRKMNKVADNSKPKKKTAGLEGFLRQASDLEGNDDADVDSRPIGESGRTEISDHFIHLTKLSNSEVEEFLESQANASVPEPGHVNNVTRDQSSPATKNSTLNFPVERKGPKPHKNRKHKLKKLINKLIRHLGKTLTKNLKQNNANIKVQISLKNQDDSGQNPSKSLDPKVTVQFEMTL